MTDSLPAAPRVLALGVPPAAPGLALRSIRTLRRLLPDAVFRYPPALAPALTALLLRSPASSAENTAPGSGAWVAGSEALLLAAYDSWLLPAVCCALEEGLPVLCPESAEARADLGQAAVYLAPESPWTAYLAALEQLERDEHEREAVRRRGRAWARHLRRKLDGEAALPLGSGATAASPTPAWLPPVPASASSTSRTEHSPDAPPASPRKGASPPPAPGFRRLSVVLALHGQRPLTEQCLRTLRADLADLSPEQEAEILCVDNGSPDDTRAWLQRQPDLHLVLLPENRGCPGGWNAGLRAATGDVLCVLNNDTLIHPGGMRALAQAAWETGIAAMAGGVLNRRLEYVRMTEDPAEADYADGCALAFRRDVFQAVGPFDEGMGLGYCEDSDWGLRARSRGYRFAIVPGILTHLGGQTAQTVSGVSEGQARNLERLRGRWAGKGVAERIVVHRSGALGDVVMATPVLAALREAQPLAWIVLECAADLAEAFQGLPFVDTVTGGSGSRGTQRIDLDDAYEVLQREGEWRHPTLAYAERAGVAVRDFRYHLPETPEWDEWAAGQLPGSGYVACGLRSAFRPKANWSERGWIELARAAPGRMFVLLDGKPRPQLEVQGRYRGRRLYELPNVLDLTGHTPSIRQLIALLRRCEACVTVDTGMWHLAAAAGLPTVAVVGATAAWARAPLSGKHRVIAGQAPCYPCQNVSRCSREDGPHCLAGVTGAAVAHALEEVAPWRLREGTPHPSVASPPVTAGHNGAAAPARELATASGGVHPALPPIRPLTTLCQARIEATPAVTIFASWYLEDPAQLWLAELWRQALRRFAPGIPVLLIDNGGPVPPPFGDVELLPVVSGTMPHGRTSRGHPFNYWHSLTYGFRVLADRGVSYGIFVEQDVVAGVPFVEPCVAALAEAELLVNLDCMNPGWAFTEYLAARPASCLTLWRRRFPPDPYTPEGGPFCEEFLPRWAAELGLCTARVPAFQHERDRPLLPTDTFTHHVPREEVERFARERGIVTGTTGAYR